MIPVDTDPISRAILSTISRDVCRERHEADVKPWIDRLVALKAREMPKFFIIPGTCDISDIKRGEGMEGESCP